MNSPSKESQLNVKSTASEPINAEDEGMWPWIRSFIYKWTRRVVGKVVLFLLVNLILYLGYLTWSHLQPLFKGELTQKTLSATSPNNVPSSSRTPPECLSPECELLRNMTRTAWTSLKTGDSLKSDSGPIAVSLSSLWVMNLTDEFEQAKGQLKGKFTLKQLSFPVQTLVANLLGGLLSVYALTKDTLFLEKAKELAKRLEPAYNRTTGLAATRFSGATNSFDNAYPWGRTLSDIGGQHVEYVYLAALTGEEQYRLLAEKRRQFLVSRKTYPKLYQETWPLSETKENENRTKSASFSSFSSAYYRSLLGTVIQYNYQSSDRHNSDLELYIEAVETLTNLAVKKAKNRDTWEELTYTGYLYYVRDYPLYATDKMRAHECFLGSMLAQGAETIERVKLSQFPSKEGGPGETYRQIARKHRQLAKELTHTCARVSARTESKLIPLTFNPTFSRLKDTKSYLGPELAQSYFTLWRLTHAQEYRDAAWKMVQAIERHCRTLSGGYAELRNVYDPSQGHTSGGDTGEYLSVTLLYLYLTFTDDSVMPLSRWFSNSAGHLLPICGVNDAYPNCPI